MKKIEAKIIADSINPQGNRITSLLLTYPRFIHSELMTHRMFSRNSASSRAIPFEKMVKMVKEDPFTPISWQFNHKGMQGVEYVTEESDFGGIRARSESWLLARDYAIQQAKDIYSMDTTKQLCNRLLEPFMWHTVLVTATEWENFFELRCPKYEYLGEEFRSKKDAINSYTFEVGFEKERLYLTSLTELDWIKLSKSGAEIHIQALAEAMWDAMNESKPKHIDSGEWHIPDFGLNKGLLEKFISDNYMDTPKTELKIATAHCAKLSYNNHGNSIDFKKDIALHDQLLKDRHLSPFEHCARAMSDEEYYAEFVKQQGANNIESGWCNNFRGWVQYRYLIEK